MCSARFIPMELATEFITYPHHPQRATNKMMERLTENWVIESFTSKILNDQGFVLQDALYALKHRSLYGAVYLIVRIHGSRNQEVEVGLTLLLFLIVWSIFSVSYFVIDIMPQPYSPHNWLWNNFAIRDKITSWQFALKCIKQKYVWWWILILKQTTLDDKEAGGLEGTEVNPQIP